MKFTGKVDWWFYAILWGVAALLLPIIYVSAFVDANAAALLVNLAVLAALELFCIPIALHNFVELQEDALLIVFGLIRKRIPYSEIAALSATHNPSSSLGASFDRIEIQRRGKSAVLISVMDKERFFAEIKKRNPVISIV